MLEPEGSGRLPVTFCLWISLSKKDRSWLRQQVPEASSHRVSGRNRGTPRGSRKDCADQDPTDSGMHAGRSLNSTLRQFGNPRAIDELGRATEIPIHSNVIASLEFARCIDRRRNDLRETREMDERVSLSLSEPNERWIQSQIDGKQFSSRSEVLNDLIRKTRETEAIRTRLKSAERSVEERGWVTGTPEELLDGFKEKARRDGQL